eukprot:2116129-Amphidinium_carterae.1
MNDRLCSWDDGNTAVELKTKLLLGITQAVATYRKVAIRSKVAVSSELRLRGLALRAAYA